MAEKPLIGLNLDFRAAKSDGPAFSYVETCYYDSVTRAGGIPVLLPPLKEETDRDQILDRLDAVVRVGGADLDPRRDGFMLHPAVRIQAARREEFDRRLVAEAAERRLPVFGIGAGMQLLNNATGGNLFLHVPEDMPLALPHKDPLDPGHRHALEVVPGTLMERVYGDGEIRVNSYHHMAVDELGDGLMATARCPDGIVEAIESSRPDWFALGTQFHPESDSASALDLRIFEEFIDGVRVAADSVRLVA
jgi:putative glutamine amidotransferase